MFSFQIAWPVWFMLALATVCATIFFLTGIRPLLVTGRKCDNDKDVSLPDKPISASIIVYTRNNEDEIREFLDSVLTQNHPCYEVIVVNDASTDRTTEVVEEYMTSHPNLYMTFVPAEAHNLSRHKLALTLGIKAARNEVIVTTAANCRIPSSEWLSLMCAGFADNAVSQSLGYASIDRAESKGWGKWYREFDSIMDSARWISRATAGKPYRGDGFNLAFLRKCFFDNDGYRSTNWMQHGEDDVFVSEISRMGGETGVILSPETLITSHWGVNNKRIWADMKERRNFTRRYLAHTPFVMAGIASASLWLTLGLYVSASLLALPSLIPTIISALLFFGLCQSAITSYRKVASGLGATRLWWGVVPFMLMRPVANLVYRERFRIHKSKNYTCRLGH